MVHVSLLHLVTVEQKDIFITHLRMYVVTDHSAVALLEVPSNCVQSARKLAKVIQNLTDGRFFLFREIFLGVVVKNCTNYFLLYLNKNL